MSLAIFVVLQRQGGRYSGFDSPLYRKLEAKWHFPQENAASHELQMETCESKPL